MHRVKSAIIMGYYYSIPIGIGCLVLNEIYENPIGKRFFPNRVGYGYKGTWSDMTSIYGKIKYQMGREYIHNDRLIPCHSGFHLCQNFFDVEDYYPMVSQGEYTGARYFLVEYNLDKCAYEGNKTVSNKLKLIEELGTVNGDIPTRKNIKNVLENVPENFSQDQKREYLLNWYRVFCYKYHFIDDKILKGNDPFFHKILYREKRTEWDTQKESVIYNLKISDDEPKLSRITHSDKNYMINYLIFMGLSKDYVMEYALASNDCNLMDNLLMNHNMKNMAGVYNGCTGYDYTGKKYTNEMKKVLEKHGIIVK
jgi:hypothetical protein